MNRGDWIAVFDTAREFALELNEIMWADLCSDIVGTLLAREEDAECEGTLGSRVTVEPEPAIVPPTREREGEDECAHEWAHSGTAYGGDDDSYHGEGRCYCVLCGADGDA